MLVSVKDPYMLVVQPDDFFINPRELDEPSSRMICFHSRYALGDRHEFRDKDEFLHKLFVEAEGGGESGEEQYDRTIETIWEKHKNAVSIPAREVDDALLEVIKQKNVVLPLGKRSGGVDLHFRRGRSESLRRNGNDGRNPKADRSNASGRGGALRQLSLRRVLRLRTVSKRRPVG